MRRKRSHTTGRHTSIGITGSILLVSSSVIG
jgi:hypothetical protein